MSEVNQPAPEGDTTGNPDEGSLTSGEAVHEANHQASLEAADQRSYETQQRLLDMLPPDRRAEVVAKQTEEAKRRLELTDTPETDLREAA